MKLFLRSLLAAALCVSMTIALGATRYVTDELRISVRTGQGEQYRIIEIIGSGTPVEVLRAAGEWAEVETPGGKTGWVRAQYLEAEPNAADQLRDSRAELARARERIEELEISLQNSQAETDSARATIDDLTARIEQLQSRLTQAERGLELAEENERLVEQVTQLETRLVALRTRVDSLRQRDRKEWFLIGAGVLFGGILLGIIVTRIPWRRRRDRMF